MLKLTAILRTVVLVGVVGYLLWAMPLGILFSGAGTREAASFKVGVIEQVASVAWIAIGWIAIETVAGWVRVWAAGRQAAKAGAAAGPPVP
jgi:hypothetical protein